MIRSGTDTESLNLTLAAEGNREAFAYLYRCYLDELYHYVYLFTHSKEETEEIVQEVFVRLWEKREKLKEVKTFKHYLFRVAKNRLLDEVRKQQIRHRVLSEIKRSSAEGAESTADEVAYREYYRIVKEAIDKLPEKRKIIFKLNTENGLSYDEIAQQLDISKSVVKKQLYLAFDYVRDYLQDKGELSLVTLTILSILHS